MKWKRSVPLIGIAIFLMIQPVIFFMHHGMVDEIDYWVGEFGLVLFAAIETVILPGFSAWTKGGEEMHQGADLQVPRIFYYIMKFVTPTFMVLLVAWWVYDGLIDHVFMRGVAEASQPYRWLARCMILGMAAFLVWGVWYAWKTHPKFFEEAKAAQQEDAV